MAVGSTSKAKTRGCPFWTFLGMPLTIGCPPEKSVLSGVVFLSKLELFGIPPKESGVQNWGPVLFGASPLKSETARTAGGKAQPVVIVLTRPTFLPFPVR